MPGVGHDLRLADVARAARGVGAAVRLHGHHDANRPDLAIRVELLAVELRGVHAGFEFAGFVGHGYLSSAHIADRFRKVAMPYAMSIAA
jgi:hypothetical protein